MPSASAAHYPPGERTRAGRHFQTEWAPLWRSGRRHGGAHQLALPSLQELDGGRGDRQADPRAVPHELLEALARQLPEAGIGEGADAAGAARQEQAELAEVRRRRQAGEAPLSAGGRKGHLHLAAFQQVEAIHVGPFGHEARPCRGLDLFQRAQQAGHIDPVERAQEWDAPQQRLASVDTHPRRFHVTWPASIS